MDGARVRANVQAKLQLARKGRPQTGVQSMRRILLLMAKRAFAYLGGNTHARRAYKPLA
jgi:hypothetical protein